MFEEQTEQLIRQRMLGALPGIFDKREGSFIGDAVSPAAIELAMAYIDLNRVLQLGFIQTTSGQYLDYKASERGLTRRAATRAAGLVSILGSPGSIVPIQSLFTTDSGLQFSTTAAAVIGSTGQTTAAVEAVEAGADGNVPVAAINSIPVSIPGVTGVTNEQEITGGTDTEPDALLAARLLEKVREPSTSGNKAQYRAWAKEVAGVGDVYIEPRWAGPDTVRIFVIDTNKQPASDYLVTSVQDYLDPVKGQGEGKAPVDHFVTVAPAVPKPISVEATVVKDAAYSLQQIQNDLSAKISGYFSLLAYSPDTTVKYIRIANYLFDAPGVLDYSNLTLNGNAGNVTVNPGEVAVLGMVTLSE